MKNNKLLYVIIGCLALLLVAAVILLVLPDKDQKAFAYSTKENTSKSSSTFSADGYIKPMIDTFGKAIDTFKVDTTVQVNYNDSKKQVNERATFVITYSELYPEDDYSGQSTYKVKGRIINLDSDNDGLTIKEDNGSTTYVNFDFNNITSERREEIYTHLNLGNYISTTCREEGRTFVVNSFKVVY